MSRLRPPVINHWSKPIMSPDDYGLDAAATASIEAAGQAKLAEKPVKAKRSTALAAAEKALEKQKPIPLLVVEAAQNLHHNAHLHRLHRLYGIAWNGDGFEKTEMESNVFHDAASALDKLASLEVTGSNTYAKLLRRYHGILGASLASVPADKRTPIGLTTLLAPKARGPKAATGEGSADTAKPAKAGKAKKEKVAKEPKAKAGPKKRKSRVPVETTFEAEVKKGLGKVEEAKAVQELPMDMPELDTPADQASLVSDLDSPDNPGWSSDVAGEALSGSADEGTIDIEQAVSEATAAPSGEGLSGDEDGAPDLDDVVLDTSTADEPAPSDDAPVTCGGGYKTKKTAHEAARRALGEGMIAGISFFTKELADGTWSWAKKGQAFPDGEKSPA